MLKWSWSFIKRLSGRFHFKIQSIKRKTHEIKKEKDEEYTRQNQRNSELGTKIESKSHHENKDTINYFL